MMPFTAPEAYVGAVAEAGEPDAGSLCFVFQQTLLLVADEPSTAQLPGHGELAGLSAAPLRRIYLGTWASALATPSNTAPRRRRRRACSGWDCGDIVRPLDDSLFALAGRALQYIDWDRTHKSCGRCGTPTRHRGHERARECPACALVAYPRIAPAVMCLIRRGREILLARSPRFAPGVQRACRIRRTRRVAGAVPGARGAGGDRRTHCRCALFCQPTLAVSAFAHDCLSLPTTPAARSGPLRTKSKTRSGSQSMHCRNCPIEFRSRAA